MTKLKLMHVIGSKAAGGAEMFFLRLMEALRKREDVELTLVVKKNSWIADELARKAIPFHALPFGGFFDFTTKKHLTNLVKVLHPQIIQGWMNRGVRDIPKDGGVYKIGRMGGYYNLKYYNHLDCIVGNTEKICTYVEENLKTPKTVQYLPNFVPLPKEGFEKEGEEIRKKLHIKKGEKVLLLAGRLHENKGIDTAIQMLPILKEKVHLLIAGKGRLQKELKQLATNLGVEKRVHFLGWVSPISPYAATADIWLAPSRIEPLGNIVLDAWAHKVPVVASKSDGPLSLITHGGNGMLAEIENAQEFANCVNELFANPQLAGKIAAAGYKELLEKFSEEAVVEKYMDFYRSLVSKREAA